MYNNNHNIWKKAHEAIHNEKAKGIKVNGEFFPVDTTEVHHLRILYFGGYAFIEQNPGTNSRWADLAMKGHEVTQVADTRGPGYKGVIVDGKVTIY